LVIVVDSISFQLPITQLPISERRGAFVEVLKGSTGGRVLEGLVAEVEDDVLVGHEAGGWKEAGLDLVENAGVANV